MILSIVGNEKIGYQFQLMEDLDFHPLSQTTVDDLIEYRKYLEEQMELIKDILS